MIEAFYESTILHQQISYYILKEEYTYILNEDDESILTKIKDFIIDKLIKLKDLLGRVFNYIKKFFTETIPNLFKKLIAKLDNKFGRKEVFDVRTCKKDLLTLFDFFNDAYNDYSDIFKLVIKNFDAVIDNYNTQTKKSLEDAKIEDEMKKYLEDYNIDKLKKKITTVEKYKEVKFKLDVKESITILQSIRQKETSTAYILGSQAQVSQLADIVRLQAKVKNMKDTENSKEAKNLLLTNLNYLTTIYNRFADINGKGGVRDLINERILFIAKECDFETKKEMR